MTPQYRYFVNSTQVYPKNGIDQSFTFKRKSDASYVFELELDKEFIFKSNGEFDFKAQQQANICTELAFKIEQRCGSSWAILWEGVFTVAEGEFDDYSCLFTIKPQKKLFLLDDIVVNMLDVPELVRGSSVIGVKSISSPAATYPNCRWLKDVILYAAKKSNEKIVSVISNFFQVNPTGAFPLPVTNRWAHLALASLSDIQQPVPSNQATIENITFKKLMDDLYAILGVQWYIDSNYNIRIEHETFFEGSPGLDVTTVDYEKYVKGYEKYKYDLRDIPKQEIFRIIDHHNEVNLTYTGLANLNKNKNALINEATTIRTDLYKIKVGLENQTVDGLFMFATDGGLAVGTEVRVIEVASNRNDYLSPGYVVPNLRVYNRSSLYAIYTSIDKRYRQYTLSGGIELESMRPVLEQEEFSVPICCAGFEPKDQVVTALGNGYVQEAKYDGQKGFLNLKLKYKIDNCSDIEPSDIDGLDLWLKFNEGITQSTGDHISQWDDASGNARHAVSSGITAEEPRWVSGHSVYFEDDSSIGGTPDLSTKFHHLTTPAFQLFPSKRGTIIMLLSNESVPYNGGFTPVGPLGPIPVLSTMDGGAGPFFDIFMDASHLYRSSYWSAQAYPVNGSDTLNGWGPNGLYVIRRGADDKVYCRHNSIECIDNPMVITNNQQANLPLIIGRNPNHGDALGSFELAELMVYSRELTLQEIENIEIYLIKKGIYNRTYPT